MFVAAFFICFAFASIPSFFAMSAAVLVQYSFVLSKYGPAPSSGSTGGASSSSSSSSSSSERRQHYLINLLITPTTTIPYSSFLSDKNCSSLSTKAGV